MLTTQMDSITEQLIRGEITQEEALTRQRTLLGAEIEQPTTEQSPPAVSLETKVESCIAKYQARKEAVIDQLKEIERRAAEVEAERQRIAGAISAAESKSRILSGSPGAYRSEKADLIARGLMGEKVDMAALKSDSEEFADSVSAADLLLGIKHLRSQLQDIERKKVGVEADKRRISHEFFEAHAREHGIRFAFLASQLANEYASITAAHRASLSLGNSFSTLAPESLSRLQINNPLPDEIMRECGVQRREWSGMIIEQTAAVQNAGASMFAEMRGAA